MWLIASLNKLSDYLREGGKEREKEIERERD